MRKLVYVLLLFSVHFTAHAIDPRLNWQTLETRHFKIHFASGYESLARHVADIAEHTHTELSKTLHWEPGEKTHVVLSDETDMPNGFAIPFPYNRTVLFLAPPDELNTLEDFDDWLALLVLHEYVHILHLDMASGIPDALRSVFGRNVLLFPNMYQPAWIIEGLATYLETDHQHQTGRGQSTLFATMMAEEVRGGIKPLSQANLKLRSWPMGTTYYLYGVHFFQFLEQTYGSETIDSLLAGYSDNIIPFMINSNASSVLGKDLDQLWQEFDVWLKQKYRGWIHLADEESLTGDQALTNDGYFTGPVKVADDGSVYFVKGGPFEHPALYKIDKQQQHRLVDVHSHVRMDSHKQKGILIAQPEFCDYYNLNFDLYVLAPGTKELKRLTECGRYRSATWSPDGRQIIAVQTHKSLSGLVLLDDQGTEIERLWQGEYGDIIGQPDWSPDGRHLVAAVFRPQHGWNIELFDMQQRQWQRITDDRAIDASPEYDASGESIVFSSERDGHYNIYRYVFADAELQQLTRVASAALRPSQHDRSSDLYYLAYSRQGYDLHRASPQQLLDKVSISPAAEPAAVPFSFAKADIESVHEYQPWSSLRPRWWFPITIMDDDKTEIGLTTSGNDAVGRHSYIVNATYDLDNEWLAGNVSYQYLQQYAFGVSRSTDVLRDQFGDFAVARREDSAYFNAWFPWRRYDYRFSLLAGVNYSHETDGRRAPGIPPLADFDDSMLGVAALFNNSQRFIRSISANRGRDLRLVAETSDVLSSDYSGEVYLLDWREYLPLGGQHVLALRYARGYGTEQPEPFRLGGEDTELELVDLLVPVYKPVLGRREFPLRGYATGWPQLRGRRMELASIEYRFPIGLVERGLMAPPVGVIQWSGNLFTDIGATWDQGSSPDDYYTGIGIEVDAELSLFYGLNLQARFGLASGQDEQIGDERAYFSIGASF